MHAGEEQKLAKLADALEKLISADSVPAMRDVVAHHPELLDDVAIQVLAGTAENVPERLQPRVKYLIAALAEWRALGLDAVVEEFAKPHDLTEDLVFLVTAKDTADLRAVVAQYPELLGDAAERRLLEMEADSSAYTADRLYAIITFLRACRGGDIDAACAAYDHGIAEVEDANRLAAEYSLMTDKQQEIEFLREHPVLLGRQAEMSLASLGETFNEPGLAANYRTREKLETIRRLRDSQRAGH